MFWLYLWKTYQQPLRSNQCLPSLVPVGNISSSKSVSVFAIGDEFDWDPGIDRQFKLEDFDINRE